MAIDDKAIQDELRFLAAKEAGISFIPGRRGRRPANLPRLTDNQGGALPRYLVEKSVGIRRENGALKLKRLTARHYRIIGGHVAGLSIEQIAHEQHVTIGTVSRILNDPLAQNMLKRVYTHREEEIQALGAVAIQAVREGLKNDQPIGTRLRAVGSYAKIREVMLPADKGKESAEDVIARMLANGSFVNNGTINISQNQQVNNGVTDETA